MCSRYFKENSKRNRTQGDFVRWGNLSPQKHDIQKERYYHTPPVERGFYAFPRGFIETFLLGGVGKGSLYNGRYSKFKDKTGKPYKIKGSDFPEFKKKFSKNIQPRLRLSFSWEDVYGNMTYEDYEKELANGIWDVWIENKPIHFSYGGLIWHHLFSEPPQLDKEFPNYLKIVDSWVLTDMPTYLRCLKAEYGRGKWQSAFTRYYDDDGDRKKRHRQKGIGFNYGGGRYDFSKDHFEVYIESIQKDI